MWLMLLLVVVVVVLTEWIRIAIKLIEIVAEVGLGLVRVLAAKPDPPPFRTGPYDSMSHPTA